MVPSRRIAKLNFSLFVWGAILLFSTQLWARPEAHILRIDPQTSLIDGAPTLTTVIDITDPQSVGQATFACAEKKGDAHLDCLADTLEKPGAWGTSHALDPEDVFFGIKIGETDYPAKLLNHARFGEIHNEPRIGTAYLLVIDADSRVGKAFDELQQVATQFVQAMGAHDWVEVVYLGTNAILYDSGWLTRAGQKTALDAILTQKKPVSSKDRTRPLLDLIKKSASDAFRNLSSKQSVAPPLHQTMVVLSSGYGGGDPSTTGPGAAELSKYLTIGRLDSDNNALPKLPIPLISVFTPPNTQAEHVQLARSFMENLANQQIGGFYTVIRDGQADHASRIVDAVRSRFAQMTVARFSLSCVAPTLTQSFTLLFRNKSQDILGDSSFSNVPMGFDPSQWPLDIDAELTRKYARDQGGIHPGGILRVFGNFCWGTDITRPEIYFIPPGETLPTDLTDEKAKQDVQKRLISLDMRGKATQANSSFVEYQVPESNQILHGDGERRTVRVVVVDGKQRRTSGLTDSTVLTLKGQELPLPMLPILVAAGGGLFLLVGLGLLLRRGSKRSAVKSSRDHIPAEDSPYVRPAPVNRISRDSRALNMRATLTTDLGRFVVLPGTDLRVGRDGARVAAVLAHPQVSGLHATFRLEDKVLKVRDESSSSGTRIGGRLITAEEWEPVAHGAEVSLGPVVLTVTIEHTDKLS